MEFDAIYQGLITGEEKLALVGLGYVGMPLAVEFAKHVPVIGFDINEKRVNEYANGIDATNEVGEAIKNTTVDFTSDPARLREAKFLIVAVPTPVNPDNTPDLRPIEGASRTVGQNLTPGSIVVFESTVYPGVTEDICIPIIEKESGLKCGEDWKIGYSPERINPGDCVLVEQSTFFPALQTFRSADARIIGVPVDEHGMRTDLLDGYCARFRPKLIYTVPTFQNPTGTTLSPERRSELIDVARRYQCLIVEDDAYGDLWYGGESSDAHRPIPLKGMENAGYVMYLSTFSKTVTSGLRTGWVVADPHVINRLAALRRMVDQHTSTSSQRICLELLKEGRIAEHLRGLIKAYRIRRDAAIAALEQYAPDEVYWTVPAGGYYIWVSLPDGVRSLDVLESCRSQGVTFMPGSVFDVDEMDDSHIRLNFVRPDAADIDTGIRIIGETIAQM